MVGSKWITNKWIRMNSQMFKRPCPKYTNRELRQFRNVDQEWFDKLNFSLLNNWLNQIIDSEDFSSIMKKFKKWEPNDLPIYTNFE